MKKVELRHQHVSDAKRFFEILDNDNFVFFPAHPKSVEEEKEFLRGNKKRVKDNFGHNYTILYDGRVVGGCGIKINQHRTFEGEIGYFLDEEVWGKGITTQAVKKLEIIGFKELGISRMVIVMDLGNVASRRVAEKCGYRREGIMKKAVQNKGKKVDVYLYAKVK